MRQARDNKGKKMTKPVKFETYEWRTLAVPHTLFDVARDGLVIMHNSNPWFVVANTAAESRALAAKIAERADAKEASERVTFAELDIKEWFEFASGKHVDKEWLGAPIGPCQKVNDTHFYIERSTTLYPVPCSDVAVTRLRATFTPEEVK
jgi:hypothetical protein